MDSCLSTLVIDCMRAAFIFITISFVLVFVFSLFSDSTKRKIKFEFYVAMDEYKSTIETKLFTHSYKYDVLMAYTVKGL